MKTYKVCTKWKGYSEIEVEANSPKEAGEKVLAGDYDITREACTGGDLEYGFEDEEVLEVEEVDDEE